MTHVGPSRGYPYTFASFLNFKNSDTSDSFPNDAQCRRWASPAVVVPSKRVGGASGRGDGAQRCSMGHSRYRSSYSDVPENLAALRRLIGGGFTRLANASAANHTTRTREFLERHKLPS